MPLRWTDLIVDCRDPKRLAEFWSALLGYKIVHESPRGSVWVGATELPRRDTIRGGPILPLIEFIPVPEAKQVKNRLHIDMASVGASLEEEVERAISLGARRIDIGQGDVPWVVMADPEGNEFCIGDPFPEDA